MFNNDLGDNLGDTSDTFKFSTDGNGNYGYVKKVGGADTFIPFKKGEFEETTLWINSSPTSTFSSTNTIILSQDITDFDYISFYIYTTTSNTILTRTIMSVEDFRKTNNEEDKPRLSCSTSKTGGYATRAFVYDSKTIIYPTNAYSIKTSALTVTTANSNVIPYMIKGLKII